MINKHLTSLELSKKLKKAGVPQKGLFYWMVGGKLSEPTEHLLIAKDEREKYSTTAFTADTAWSYCRAFLSSELGELLPFQIYPNNQKYDSKNWTLRIQNDKGVYLLVYERIINDDKKGRGIEILHSVAERTEAEARGKMLLYLIEKGIIKFKGEL